MGKLEAAHLWQGNIVCGPCNAVLANQHAASIPYASKGGGKAGDEKGDNAVVVELAAKRLKKWLLISAGSTIVGLLMCGVAAFRNANSLVPNYGPNYLALAGGAVFMLSLLAFILVRAVAWWHHG